MVKFQHHVRKAAHRPEAVHEAKPAKAHLVGRGFPSSEDTCMQGGRAAERRCVPPQQTLPPRPRRKPALPETAGSPSSREHLQLHRLGRLLQPHQRPASRRLRLQPGGQCRLCARVQSRRHKV